jgi:hypothetical protein
MKLPHPAWRVSLLLAVTPATGHCDPADEGPPPATAQSAPGDPTQPVTDDTTTEQPPSEEAPSPAIDEGSEPGPNASGEYSIGEDPDSYDDNDPAALSDFRGALDPYGSWADDSTYGTVWVPSAAAVGADFQPYVSAGHWTYDDDWTWASDYPWGWAPFHYGRWVWIEPRGWSWIPGRTYRGAWVEWSVDDGYSYVGWAPAPPVFIWLGGLAVGWRGPYVGPRWAYCPHAAVFAPELTTHVVTGPLAAPIAARMRLYVPTAARIGGPPPDRIGFTAAQVAHPTGDSAANLARAMRFARPSTALALGARPASRVAPVAGMRGPASRLPGAVVPSGRSTGVRRVNPNGPGGTPHPGGGGGVHFNGGGHFGVSGGAGGGGHGGGGGRR